MENEPIETLKLAIRKLIIQEVRLLRTEQTYPYPFVIGEMKRSIQEAKNQVAALTRFMGASERNELIKKFIDDSMEEEIDEAIESRKNKCLRCIHIRYLDEKGAEHVNLPHGKGGDVRGDISAMTICCETPSVPGASCFEFVEKLGAVPIDDYLAELSFLYEVRERLDEIEEMWEYLTR
jgi:hypothetical protein